MKGKKLTIEQCERILDCLDYYCDYEVTDIYEDSFRAIRRNEWILSELNVEVNSDPSFITNDNVFEFTSICTHVLRRFK